MRSDVFDRPVDYAKRVFLTTDSKVVPAITITTRAAIGLPLVVEPAEVDFGKVEVGKTYTRTVTVINRGVRPIKLLYSTSDMPGCVALVPREPVPARGRIGVLIRWVAQNDPPTDDALGNILVHTDSDTQAVVRLIVDVRGSN